MLDRDNRSHGARWLARLLGLGQILVGVAAVGAALWMLISFPVWWGDAPRITLPVAITSDSAAGALGLDSGDSPFVSWEPDRMMIELDAKLANPWAQWIFVFLALQELVIAFLIIHFLKKVVGSISRGEAFSADNAGRLRWIGALMILEHAVGPGFSVIVSNLALRGFEFAGGDLSMPWFRDFGSGGFIAGWIVIVLSEVFRQGAAMKQEQQLTI